MQRSADQAVLDGLQEEDRRHGWRGGLRNMAEGRRRRADSYDSDDWHGMIEKGSYVTGLVRAVDNSAATVKIGPYAAMVSASSISWTWYKSPGELLKAGDLALFKILDITGTTAKVELEQPLTAQGALLAIDNPSGEIKAMVGGSSFEDSKFDRATQALRQTGSSFKVYVDNATAIQQGFSPFDTIVDAPVSFRSGGQEYSPKNYDEKFEGRITLRLARICAMFPRGAAAGSGWSAEGDRYHAAIWDYQPIAAVSAAGAWRG